MAPDTRCFGRLGVAATLLCRSYARAGESVSLLKLQTFARSMRVRDHIVAGFAN